MLSDYLPSPLLARDDLGEAKWYIYHLLGYQPHPGQRVFHHGKERFKVLIAGSRFGKSLAAVREVLPWLLIRNTRGWIVGPSYRLAEKEMRYMLADLRTLGTPAKSAHFGGATGSSYFDTAWSAEVHALSAVHEHTLFGEEVDWMLLSEAAQMRGELFTRVLRGRLATRKGVLVVPTTPKGFNWVHDLYQRGQDAEFPEWGSYQYTTSDNPLIDAEEIEEARRTLPPEDFAEQFEGTFTTRRGLVYPEFEAGRHVIAEPLEIAGLEKFGAIDFGFTNPLAFLFAVRLDDGRLYIFNEYYARERTSAEHLSHFGATARDELEVVYADPSGAQLIADLHAYGITMQPARNGVLAGIDRVRQALIAGALVVDARCENLIREFSRYSWAEDNGRGLERVPIKLDDHALDALRYLMAGLSQRTARMQLR